MGIDSDVADISDWQLSELNLIESSSSSWETVLAVEIAFLFPSKESASGIGIQRGITEGRFFILRNNAYSSPGKNGEQGEITPLSSYWNDLCKNL